MLRRLARYHEWRNEGLLVVLRLPPPKRHSTEEQESLGLPFPDAASSDGERTRRAAAQCHARLDHRGQPLGAPAKAVASRSLLEQHGRCRYANVSDSPTIKRNLSASLATTSLYSCMAVPIRWHVTTTQVEKNSSTVSGSRSVCSTGIQTVSNVCASSSIVGNRVGCSEWKSAADVYSGSWGTCASASVELRREKWTVRACVWLVCDTQPGTAGVAPCHE